MQLHRRREQHDRVVFNGVDLSTLVMCKVQRPVMAPVEATFETVPGCHGETFKRARRTGFDLPVDVWLRTEDRREVAEVRHRLAKALWTEEPAPLFLPDDPTRYLLAIVSGDTDLGTITDECPSGTVTFHVGDPDHHGQARRADVSSGSVSIDFGGDLPTYVGVTAKPGAGSSWRITNTDTAEFVEVATTLTADSTIGIDMERERATVNGQTAPVTLDSDFFEVDGRTHLSISSGTATLEWEERWL